MDGKVSKNSSRMDKIILFLKTYFDFEISEDQAIYILLNPHFSLSQLQLNSDFEKSNHPLYRQILKSDLPFFSSVHEIVVTQPIFVQQEFLNAITDLILYSQNLQNSILKDQSNRCHNFKVAQKYLDQN